MGSLRFWRRKRILPGVTLNFSKRGVSTSVGVRGAHVTFGRRGVRRTVGIPGTGLYYTSMTGRHRQPVASAQPRHAGCGCGGLLGFLAGIVALALCVAALGAVAPALWLTVLVVAGVMLGSPGGAQRVRGWRIWQYVPGLDSRTSTAGFLAVLLLYAVPVPLIGFLAVYHPGGGSNPSAAAPPATPAPTATDAPAGAPPATTPTATPTATSRPTPVPTTTLTLTPAPPPPVVVAPPPPPPASTRIVSVTSPVSPGDETSVTAQSGAGISCTIQVVYDSGPSHAQGLGPQTTDASGSVTWSWRVGTRTAAGTYPVTVSCGTDGSARATFTVS